MLKGKYFSDRWLRVRIEKAKAFKIVFYGKLFFSLPIL